MKSKNITITLTKAQALYLEGFLNDILGDTEEMSRKGIRTLDSVSRQIWEAMGRPDFTIDAVRVEGRIA